MPRAKSLTRHVLDQPFRSRRHHELLAGPAVPWPQLAALQGAYNATSHPLERRAIGVEFERAVRAIDEDEAEAGARAAAEAELRAIIDAESVEIDLDAVERDL